MLGSNVDNWEKIYFKRKRNWTIVACGKENNLKKLDLNKSSVYQGSVLIGKTKQNTGFIG